MDLLSILALVVSVTYTQAIKCHDCTSWNPYCREKVNEPFSDAVATVDCAKTDTCFIKKEESGVISRGCTDWWMETQVDIDYEGCRTQDVQWMGKQTWCFCKSDHCNGGSVEELEAGIVPDVPQKAEKSNKIQDDGWVGWDFSRDWQQWETNSPNDANTDADSAQSSEWTNWDEIVTVPWSEWEHDGTGIKTTPAPAENVISEQKFDDTNPEYSLEEIDHSQDPAWQLWWWHADSDRPHFNEFEKTWKAPSWVESHDGAGWDFPVTGRDDRTRTTTTEKQWTWGRGWGHIFPWWSGRRSKSTVPAPATTASSWYETTAAPTEHNSLMQNEGENTLDETVEKDQGSNDLQFGDISKAEFFCWDCYSDSPLCGERVDTLKAHYLGKTPCPSTNKCFVRKQGNVIYRGCADGWTSSVISHDYVGCRTQMLWGKPVEWCFCTASLCNGDSMTDIQDKYLEPQPELFKDANTTGSIKVIPTENVYQSTTDEQTTQESTVDSSSWVYDDTTTQENGSTKEQTTKTKTRSRLLAIVSRKELRPPV